MDSVEVPRLRKLSLKPIQTSRENGEGMIATGEKPVEEQPLSPVGRLFHEPHYNVYIIVIVGWKTRIDPGVFKANLVHTLLKHPRFSSLQVVNEEKGKEMKWVQTKVNLENHVIVPYLDPTCMDSTDKFVEDYISNLSKTTIDMSKPLWDLHLLNVRTSDAEATSVFRIHHSIGDGTSLMSLLLACTRKISDPEALPSISVTKKSNLTNSGRFWSAIRLAWNTTVDLLMFVMTTLFLNDTETPLKGPPGVASTPRRFVHRTLNLNDVKLVKNAMSTTINDVMLGVTQAGLSRYLNRKYGEGKKDKGATEKKNNLSKNIRLRATHFINLRPSAGIHALADMMEKGAEARWGNRIGYVLFPFTIALRDDPLDYVREAKAAIDRKKLSLEAIYTYTISDLSLKFFGIKTASALSHRISAQTTMWFSNVVGPQEEIGLFGHPMAYIAPSLYGQPSAFMIHVVSYVDKMTMVLSVDEGTIPDPHQLCDDLEESLKLIKDAVIARGLVKDDVQQEGTI